MSTAIRPEISQKNPYWIPKHRYYELMKQKSTLGNKILAVCLLVLSAIPMIMEKEATGFILMCMVAIPLFFAKRNYIYV